MSNEAQETEVSDVTDEAVQNEPQTQDESQTEPEVAEEQDNEEVVEQSPEERLKELEQKLEKEEAVKKRQRAAYHDLQRAHERKLKEFQELEAKLQPAEPVKAPQVDDFDSLDAYQEALAKYHREEGMREAQKTLIEQQKQQETQRIMQQRLAKKAAEEAEYIKVNPNYTESVAEVESYVRTAQFSPAVEQAVIEQIYNGNVPQVIDYFGRNGGENLHKLAELAEMSPVQAGIEIYKIQQALKTPKKEDKPAPKPVASVKGTGGKPKQDLSKGDVLKNLGLKA